MQPIAQAQKKPTIQENSVWALEPVKVDGKTSSDNYQAYSKSTMLSYSLSNDDKNIYLVIKSTDNITNNKIMMGGITLSINPTGKKNEKEGVKIIYPLVPRQQGQRTQTPSGQRMGGGGQFPQAATGQRSQDFSDSLALARRKQQLSLVKEIKVFGIKDITDSLISIYNEHNINAAASFNDTGVFVYELSVPLNLVSLSAEQNTFSYNIKINGRQFGGGFGGGFAGQGGGFGGGGQTGGGVRVGFDPSIFLPVDFWAKYTLAKK